MEIILKYFPEISELKKKQFSQLQELYSQWNAMINVISRKDLDNFYERHVLHSLAIAKVIQFTPGTRLLDIGTGGGFPTIPLSILFPEVEFVPVDSIGKKIKVVTAVSEELDLKNVSPLNARAENVDDTFDFVTSRATAPLIDLMKWKKGKIKSRSKNTLPNGMLLLKGGDLTQEFADLKNKFSYKSTLFPISEFFEEEFFQTKSVVYIQS